MITWPRSLRFERFNAGAWRAWGPWCVCQFQRGAVVLVGAFLGGVLVWVMASDVWEAHGQAQQALDAAQAQLPSQGACLLYTSPSPRDTERSRMPSSA